MKMIQSLERGMQILQIIDCFGSSSGLSITEIAELAKLKIPTTHNFLQTFCQLGYLEQTARGKYALTDKLRVLGWNNSKKNNLIQALRLSIADLARTLDAEVLLATRSGLWWQVVLKYTGSSRFSITADLPTNENFYISATGRCLLSSLSDAELNEFVSKFRLPDSSEWQEADSFENLQKELTRIRQNQYAVYHTADGRLVGVATPAASFKDASQGSLGIILPIERYKSFKLNNLTALLAHAAQNQR